MRNGRLRHDSMPWTCAMAGWLTVAMAHASGFSPIRRWTDTPVRVLTATSRSRRRSRARKAAPVSPARVGVSASTYSDAVAPRRLAGHAQASAHGALPRWRLVPEPGFRRVHQTPRRQPRGRAEHFEKRDVHRPHDPAVEAAARRQDPEQLRPGTRDPHDDVGARLAVGPLASPQPQSASPAPMSRTARGSGELVRRTQSWLLGLQGLEFGRAFPGAGPGNGG